MRTNFLSKTRLEEESRYIHIDKILIFSTNRLIAVSNLNYSLIENKRIKNMFNRLKLIDSNRRIGNRITLP